MKRALQILADYFRKLLAFLAPTASPNIAAIKSNESSRGKDLRETHLHTKQVILNPTGAKRVGGGSYQPQLIRPI